MISPAQTLLPPGMLLIGLVLGFGLGIRLGRRQPLQGGPGLRGPRKPFPTERRRRVVDGDYFETLQRQSPGAPEE